MTSRRHLVLVQPPPARYDAGQAPTWSEILERDCSPELAFVCRLACELAYRGVDQAIVNEALSSIVEYESECTPERDQEAERVFALAAFAAVIRIMDPSRGMPA